MDIVLQNVSKNYGEKRILQDFSCRFPAASRSAVMAPSGTGKTTLLRLILGLEKTDSGEITGVPEKKAALFQEDRLCPNLSVKRNIQMAIPKCSEAAIRSILEELGMKASVDSKASALSGGMARRAALARALLAEGGLLILDEPFSGLDEENRILAGKAILSHRNNRTLILVTHRQEDLELLGIENCLILP